MLTKNYPPRLSNHYKSYFSLFWNAFNKYLKRSWGSLVKMLKMSLGSDACGGEKVGQKLQLKRSVENEVQDHGITWVRRDLGRSLVQPLAQIIVGCEGRQVYVHYFLSFYHVILWRAWLCRLDDSLGCIGWYILGPLKHKMLITSTVITIHADLSK